MLVHSETVLQRKPGSSVPNPLFAHLITVTQV